MEALSRHSCPETLDIVASMLDQKGYISAVRLRLMSRCRDRTKISPKTENNKEEGATEICYSLSGFIGGSVSWSHGSCFSLMSYSVSHLESKSNPSPADTAVVLSARMCKATCAPSIFWQRKAWQQYGTDPRPNLIRLRVTILSSTVKL